MSYAQNVYLTGGSQDDLEAMASVIEMEGHVAAVKTLDFSNEEIYSHILDSDAVVILYGADGEQISDLGTELGIALAMGKVVYAYAPKHAVTNRFLSMGGVRKFLSMDDTLEAVLEDLKEDEDVHDGAVSDAGAGLTLGDDPGDAP